MQIKTLSEKVNMAFLEPQPTSKNNDQLYND